jgi:predicted transcriptional regulator of viral defense system
MKRSEPDTLSRAEAVFREHGGTMRTRDVLASGVHPRTLYWMRDNGVVEQLSRGLYHLASQDLPQSPDIVTVAHRVPAGVIALVSALDLHGLTTQIPGAVWVALPRDVKTPRVVYPPMRVVHLSERSLHAGVQEQVIGATAVKVFSAGKTVADCFKFRSLVGLDVAVEALREALRARATTPAEVMEYARVDRVSAVIRPYLEAMQ